MKSQHPAPDNPAERIQNAAYLFTFLCQTFAVAVEVILHTRMGSRAIGMRGFAAFFVIPLWAAFWPGVDPQPLLLFWYLFMAACVVSRIAAIRRERRGFAESTRYTGWPRFCPRRCNEVWFKKAIEPVMVFLVGALLIGANAALGSFLMTAAVGLACSIQMIDTAERARAQDLNDAYIAQRQLMERARRLRGE